MNNPFIIKFWGVRGSHAAPGERTVQFGGNTPCVEVRCGDGLVILDAGTGIITLGRSLLQRGKQSGSPVEAALCFSHLHQDHIQGFPFFTPAYLPSTRLHLFASKALEQPLERVLAGSMRSPLFPVRLGELGARKRFYALSESSVVLLGPSVGGVKVCDALSGGRSSFAPAVEGQAEAESLPPDVARLRTLRSSAHPGGVLVYRIEYRAQAVVYATDIEGYVDSDRRLAAFAQGAEVLIHDAQYTDAHYRGQVPGLPATQGWGHSTASMACALAQAASVRQLVLFHHDPSYDDAAILAQQEQARQLFPNSLAAYEGLEIELGRGEGDGESPAKLGRGEVVAGARPELSPLLASPKCPAGHLGEVAGSRRGFRPARVEET